jgi:hypothetical protein
MTVVTSRISGEKRFDSDLDPLEEATTEDY